MIPVLATANAASPAASGSAGGSSARDDVDEPGARDRERGGTGHRGFGCAIIVGVVCGLPDAFKCGLSRPSPSEAESSATTSSFEPSSSAASSPEPAAEASSTVASPAGGVEASVGASSSSATARTATAAPAAAGAASGACTAWPAEREWTRVPLTRSRKISSRAGPRRWSAVRAMPASAAMRPTSAVSRPCTVRPERSTSKSTPVARSAVARASRSLESTTVAYSPGSARS